MITNNKFKDLKNFLINNSISIETNLDENIIINKITSLGNSNSTSVTFFNDIKHIDVLKNTKARCCLIEKKYVNYLPNSCSPLIVENPYLAFAVTTNFFKPDVISSGIVSKYSEINSNCIYGNNLQLGNFSSIKENVKIGNNVIIKNNVTVGPNVEIEDNVQIMSGCVLSNVNISKYTQIKSGAIIGQKGFGFELSKKILIKHTGNVIIGKYSQIGSNTTIDRAALDSTVIGDNVMIDNLVQIAHNVNIGDNTVIAAQCGIAGSTSIGRNCILGGQVGIAGHLIIGDYVIIAAKSGVTKNIQSNSTIAGFPARDIKLWKKSIIKQMKDIK